MSDLVPEIITGLPAATKARPRADFRPSEFDQAITTKGYRMYWSRAGICPCENNPQTEQPDIICPLCHGDSFYHFLPDAALVNGGTDAFGNEIKINDAGDGVMIYVLMTSMVQDPQIFEKFGEWVFGTAKVTTQHQNKLGYKDRLIGLDSELTYAQIVEYNGEAEIQVTGRINKEGFRYPFIGINQFRSISQVYRPGSDYLLTPQGTIEWQTGKAPEAGTRLSVHGTVRPVWIVMDQLNAYRDTQLEGSSPDVASQQHQRLPVHAMAKLDFLVNPD